MCDGDVMSLRSGVRSGWGVQPVAAALVKLTLLNVKPPDEIPDVAPDKFI